MFPPDTLDCAQLWTLPSVPLLSVLTSPLPAGQFWNIDVALEKFNDTADEPFPHYIVHLRPPAPAQARSFVGELYSTKWDNTPEPCIYVGSNQAGTGRSDLPPLGTIVEGAYDDYIVGGAFDYTYQFTRFESESCRPDPIMEA